MLCYLNVAITRLRAVRSDAQRDELICRSSHLQSAGDSIQKFLFFQNQMVTRSHYDIGFRV